MSMNQAQRQSGQVRIQIEALRREIAHESGEIERMRQRRADIAGRKVRSEARKARFLKRLDNEIRAAEQRRALAEANMEGLAGNG